jgi:hypothetical protein
MADNCPSNLGAILTEQNQESPNDLFFLENQRLFVWGNSNAAPAPAEFEVNGYGERSFA